MLIIMTRIARPATNGDGSRTFRERRPLRSVSHFLVSPVNAGCLGGASAPAPRSALRIDSFPLLELQHLDAALAVVRSLYEARISLCGVVFVSARMGSGLDTLIAAIRPHLTEGPPFYDVDILVDRPEKFIAADIIR